MRDFGLYYTLASQAELAPTEIIFIDTCHVGATYGCDNEKRHGRKGSGVCGFLVYKLPKFEAHQHS